jgi:hypothetical protein
MLNRTPVRTEGLHDDQVQAVRELNLLSFKPVIYVANLGENARPDGDAFGKLKSFASGRGALCIPFYGKVQAEIAELEHDEQREFLKAMGVSDNGVQTLIQAGYAVLHLITFFTANENEARAWTIATDTPVVNAAGRVHSDFEEHFIKAEVVPWSDLEKHDSMKTMHDHGLVQVHGRDYLVKDGDLVYFRVKK